MRRRQSRASSFVQLDSPFGFAQGRLSGCPRLNPMSFELLAEGGELLLDLGELLAEAGDFFFKSG